MQAGLGSSVSFVIAVSFSYEVKEALSGIGGWVGASWSIPKKQNSTCIVRSVGQANFVRDARPLRPSVLSPGLSRSHPHFVLAANGENGPNFQLSSSCLASFPRSAFLLPGYNRGGGLLFWHPPPSLFLARKGIVSVKSQVIQIART